MAKRTPRIALPILIAGALLVLTACVYAQYEYWSAPEPAWLKDFPKAIETARAEHRFLMIFFHDDADWGSKEFQARVFTGNEFRDFANRKVVLLDCDLSAGVPPPIRERNCLLMNRLGVAGVPSIVFLNEKEEVGGVIEGFGPVPGGHDWMEVLNAYRCNPGCCQVTNRFKAGAVSEPRSGL